MRQWLTRWNTLRNQMLAGFLSVMMIVLFCAGIITYNSVSKLLKTKAEKQIKQTAVQANGRLDALIDQIETLTTQAVNEPYVQQLMLSIVNGEEASFSQRQSLSQIANKIQAYSSGVSSVEVYTRDHRQLYPLDDRSLSDRVGSEWISQANDKKGRIVWIGVDSENPDTVLALRRINLVDRWFSNGGYMLIRIHRSYFQFQGEFSNGGRPEMMLLADGAARPIVAGGQLPVDMRELMNADAQTVTLDGRRYMLVKQPSEPTGWTLMILYSMRDITDGISVLRLAVMTSGAIGFLLFLVLSLLLSTMITQPLKKLTKAMRSTRLGVLTPNPDVSVTAEIHYLNTTYNQMIEELNRLIKLVYEKETLRSRAELHALQAQINPHFLYNTLEALYWSLQEKGQEDLAELVIAMSELFRYVIGGPDRNEWVTVGKELDHIERYLRIMSVRFGSRLAWRIEAEAELREVRMPKLLIQPLVENAILHGLESKSGQGLVVVRARPSPAAARALQIEVADNGPGMGEELLRAVKEALSGSRMPAGRGSGMGLLNVQRRLQLYYPSRAFAGLTVDSAPGRGTTVGFDLPIMPKGEEESPDDPLGENHSGR